MSLALVQAGVGSALHIGVEQPVEYEERSFDPGDPMGKMFFNILATFAEFEADLIRMRTREGMAIARAKGKLRGKQPKLSDRQQRELCRMHTTGEYSISDLAELCSVSRPTGYRTRNRHHSPSVRSCPLPESTRQRSFPAETGVVPEHPAAAPFPEVYPA